MTSVRYLCPWCPNTYADTSGIMNHLKQGAHPEVSNSRILKSETQVNCKLEVGNWVVCNSNLDSSTLPRQSLSEAMGYGAPNVSVSDAADGSFMSKTQAIRHLQHDQAGVVRMQDDSKFRGWKTAASCFLTTVNEEIANAAFIELTLLSNDKTFCVVECAPANYSSDLARLLLYICEEKPGPGIIQAKLIELLEDKRPSMKQPSRLIEFASALLCMNSNFDDPDRFQASLTRIKHALKGAALLKFRQSKNADSDSSWADKHLVAKCSSFNELQRWKRIARRCIVHKKVPRIRWLPEAGKIEVCTNPKADTWCHLNFEQLCRLVHGCIDVTEQIIKKFGVTLFTEDDLLTLKDPEDVPVGTGMMQANNDVSMDRVVLPLLAREVLNDCYEGGNRLGTAMSYSGAGVMRTAQLGSITTVQTNAGNNRGLRLFRGRVCVKYGSIKQDGLISSEQERVFKNVLKFCGLRLSIVAATWVIKIKPFQIAAALQMYPSSIEHARAAGSLLIVGPTCLPRSTKHDKAMTLKIVNEHIVEFLPTMNVSALRHVVEAISRRAAQMYNNAHQIARGSSVTAAMAHLSAHSLETSEEVYGGDESLIFSASEEDIDLYRLCGSLYDKFVGIEVREQVPVVMDDLHRIGPQLNPCPPAADSTLNMAAASITRGAAMGCVLLLPSNISASQGLQPRCRVRLRPVSPHHQRWAWLGTLAWLHTPHCHNHWTRITSI